MYDHVWKSERQKAVEVQFRNLLKKGINFTLVGVVGAIFDYGTRFILLQFGVPAFIARGSSYIVGSIVAYYLNSFFTFKGDRSAAEKTRATISYIVCFLYRRARGSDCATHHGRCATRTDYLLGDLPSCGNNPELQHPKPVGVPGCECGR